MNFQYKLVMKKIILMIFFTFICDYGFAQNMQIKDKERINNIAKLLSVDSLYAVKVLFALDFNIEKIREILGENVLNSYEKLILVRKLQSEREAALRRLLTPAQYSKIEKITRNFISDRRSTVEKYKENQKNRIEHKIQSSKVLY